MRAGDRVLSEYDLIGTVRRLIKKWGKVRKEVFQSVFLDHPDEHVAGQRAVFWRARFSESARHPTAVAEVRALSRYQRNVLRTGYIRDRVRRSEQEVADPSLNKLQREQALARLWFFRNMGPLGEDEARALAVTAHRRKLGLRDEGEEASYSTFVGGTPAPVEHVETRPRRVRERGQRLSGGQRLSEQRSQAPVVDSPTCHLRGRLELKSGTRPQAFTLPNPIVLRDLVAEQPELLEHLGPSDVLARGAWPTSRHVLEKMATKNEGVGNVEDLVQALRCGHKTLRLRSMRAPTASSIDGVLVNPSAFPGVISSRLAPTRGQVFRACADIAKRQFDSARNGFEADLSLWSCGGREKPNTHLQPGEAIRSRLVLMPETPSTLLESAFSQPLTAMFKHVKGDVAIGTEITNAGFERLVKKFAPFSHCKAYDWSQFDSRVREDMLVVAFGVLRACYYGPEEHLDNLFLRFMSHTLVKQVVTPGGWYYTLTQGVPSGSPFTSILDSVCNWLVLVDLELQFCNKKDVLKNRRSVYGDDFVQGWGVPAPHETVFRSLAYSRWGFIAKPSAVQEGPFVAETVGSSLPFLSFRFPHGLPARPMADALRLGLLPKKPRQTVYTQAQRVSYVSHFPPFDFSVASYHQRYLGHMQDLATYDPTPRGHNVVRLRLQQAMAGFGGGIYSSNRVFGEEWYRAKSPRGLRDEHVPIAWVKIAPRPHQQQSVITANLSLLLYGRGQAPRMRVKAGWRS